VFRDIRNAIDANEGGLGKFAEGEQRLAERTSVRCLTAPSPVAISVHRPHAGYKFMGINRGEHEGKAGLWYREWAPGAKVRVFGALQCVAVVPCNNPANRLD
jgi:1,4-alpha-glucan branching enzyme